MTLPRKASVSPDQQYADPQLSTAGTLSGQLWVPAAPLELLPKTHPHNQAVEEKIKKIFKNKTLVDF